MTDIKIGNSVSSNLNYSRVQPNSTPASKTQTAPVLSELDKLTQFLKMSDDGVSSSVKFEKIRQAIEQDNYQIDFDRLTDNIILDSVEMSEFL